MRIALHDRGVDLREAAATLVGLGQPLGRHPLVNEMLLDVRGWTHASLNDVVRRFQEDALSLVAAWELTDAARWLNEASLSECEFLRPFGDPGLLQRMAYLGLAAMPDPPPHLERVFLHARREPWDALLFLHYVIRWAKRFGGLKAYDQRSLRRLNLQHPFAVAVIEEPATPQEAVLYDVLEALGVELLHIEPRVAEHHLSAWLGERLGLLGAKPKLKQQQLDFTEAGGTQNSLFVVRAAGGVDGFVVRGTVGADLGLIIDVGDREVSIAATAYLEQHVARVLNEQTDLSAQLSGGSLRLRWYDTRLIAEDLGRIIYQALKAEFLLSTISVSLVFDALRISSLRAGVYAYCEERTTQLQRRSEEHEPFIVCRACRCYAPHAFCIVTVDRPPCCGRSYDELATLAKLTGSLLQHSIDRGICRDRTRGSYMGADKAAQLHSEGTCTGVNLHSIRDNPHPTTAIPECIAHYLAELDVICVLSRDFAGRGPDGKTFDSMLRRVAGGQVKGIVGVGEEYILSSKFFAAEGGLSSVAWMNSSLKKRLGLKLDHVATEKDCADTAGLRQFLTTWRH